jgi:hypothetical protein
MKYLDVPSSEVLCGIANELFALHQTLAAFTNNWHFNEELLQRYANTFGVTFALFQALEATGQLEFADVEMPYLWNTVNWNSLEATAGVLPRDGSPRPSDLIYSQFAAWSAAANGNYPRGRLLKGVLRHCRQHGFVDATRLVVRLGQCGFAPASDRASVLAMLMRARSAVRDDSQVMELLLPGFDSWDSVIDLSNAEVNSSWLFEEGRELAPRHARPQEAVLSLLEYCMNEVNELRSSKSLDEWTVRWATTHSAIVDLMSTAALLERQPLTLRSALGQLEEIMADAGGYAGALMIDLKQGPPHGPRLLATLRDVILALPEHLHGRLTGQRVLGPAWLPLDRDSPVEVPDEGWERLGLEVMAAIATIFPESSNIEFPRRSERSSYHPDAPVQSIDSLVEEIEARTRAGVDRFTSDRQVALSLVHELLSELDRDAIDNIKVIGICEKGLDLCPWSAIFRSEMAIALDGTDRPSEALQYMREAVTLDVSNPLYWQSLGVILGRLGKSSDARLAKGFSIFLADREQIL